MAKRSRSKQVSDVDPTADTTRPSSSLGEFPFPISGGVSEPPSLTWLRNHSSYLTVGGIVDYIVPIAILASGIITNFLILLPWLLLIAVVQSYFHHWILNHPFWLTLLVAIAGVALILLQVLSPPLQKIALHRRSVERGSVDNVIQRLRRERYAGILLLVFFFVLLIEISPHAIELFRSTLGSSGPGGSQLITAAVGISAVLGSANSVLRSLKGIFRKLAAILIGTCGLVFPWLIILCFSNYLVYGKPPSELMWWVPFILLAVALVCIYVALFAGLTSRNFSRKEVAIASAVALFSTVCLVGLWQLDESNRQATSKSQERMGEISRPLSLLIKAWQDEEDNTSEAMLVFRELNERKEILDSLRDSRPHSGNLEAWHREYYEQAQAYVEPGEKLALLSEHEKHLALEVIAKQSRHKLYELLQKRVENEMDSVSLRIDDAILSRLSLKSILRRIEAPRDPSETPSLLQSTLNDATSSLDQRIAAALSETETRAFLSDIRSIQIQSQLREEHAKLAPQRIDASQTSDEPVQPARFIPLDTPDEVILRLHERTVLQFLLSEQPLSRFDSLIVRLKNQIDSVKASEQVRQQGAMAGEDSLWVEDLIAGLRDMLALMTIGERTEPETLTIEPTDDPLAKLTNLDLFDKLVIVEDARMERLMSMFTARELRYLADTNDLVFLDDPKREDVFDLVRPKDAAAQCIWGAKHLLRPNPIETLRTRSSIARADLTRQFAESEEDLVHYARHQLITIALNPKAADHVYAREVVATLYDPSIHSKVPAADGMRLYLTENGTGFSADHLTRIIAARFSAYEKGWGPTHLLAANNLARRMVAGEFGNFEGIDQIDERLFDIAIAPKLTYVLSLALVVGFCCWLAADINRTSIHNYYRDRLARAFLVRQYSDGQVSVGDDVRLVDLSDHRTKSVAPYHLINVTLNLQGSGDIGLRDRQSDFFIFSKRYVGSDRTGYCRSESLGQVFPDVTLASAMAISAAAASPNMGRITNPVLVLLLTLLNIRLGYWIPHPGIVEATQDPHRELVPWMKNPKMAKGFDLNEVFQSELAEVQARWKQAYSKTPRSIAADVPQPSVEHRLVGLALSGGGIRSATINLGIVQVLHQRGIFDHVDYLSTVSGGGYLGSCLSTLMREKSHAHSSVAGVVEIERDGRSGDQIVTVRSANGEEEDSHRFSSDTRITARSGEHVRAGHRLIPENETLKESEFDGTVSVCRSEDCGEQQVTVTEDSDDAREVTYPFTRFDRVIVSTGDDVTDGTPLIAQRNSLAEWFMWRVPPRSLYREMFGMLNDQRKWINLSDGGHIENLAAIELLRRRCQFIIIGDGEADPNHAFNGLATLIRFARIDLGIKIDIDLDPLRKDENGICQSHFAIGRVLYPDTGRSGKQEVGHLLYLKSSLSGDDEDEVIREYHANNLDFPHQTTSDQFFDEGQFEAYRSLGQHIAESALASAPSGTLSFSAMQKWIATAGKSLPATKTKSPTKQSAESSKK